MPCLVLVRSLRALAASYCGPQYFNTMVRLDHVVQQWLRLSKAPKASIKEAQRLVRNGDFTVNHVATTEPKQQVIPMVESVGLTADKDVVVDVGRHAFFLLNKPAGCVCQRHPREPTVYDLIGDDVRARHADLASVGRLDRDTTGALLLCTDGGLQSMLLFPTSRVWKTYRAELEPSTNAITSDAIDAFKAGLRLDDGTCCAPAELEWSADAPHEARVTLHEGFFHQVKRMLAQVGGVVTMLHRERFGLLEVSGLPPGQMRPLTSAEMEGLKSMLPVDRVMGRNVDGMWERSLAKRPRPDDDDDDSDGVATTGRAGRAGT